MYVWFLNSGCSNHICANKEWFMLQVARVTQVITDVFYFDTTWRMQNLSPQEGAYRMFILLE